MSQRQAKAPGSYVIQVQRHLSCDRIATTFAAEVTRGYSAAGVPITTITVSVRDQAVLNSLLNDMHDSGLHILSIRDASFPGNPLHSEHQAENHTII